MSECKCSIKFRNLLENTVSSIKMYVTVSQRIAVVDERCTYSLHVRCISKTLKFYIIYYLSSMQRSSDSGSAPTHLCQENICFWFLSRQPLIGNVNCSWTGNNFWHFFPFYIYMKMKNYNPHSLVIVYSPIVFDVNGGKKKIIKDLLIFQEISPVFTQGNR